MKKTRRKWHFTLKPGSFLLLVPAIVLIVIIPITGEDHTSIPQEITEMVTSEPSVIKVAVVTPVSKPEITVSPTAPPAEPKPNERYAQITMTEEERRELAEIIYHEARGESFEGQQAVAEVVFNRVIADNFPDTVHDVLHQKKQFSTVRLLNTAEPRQEQYDAINAALYGPTILPADVVFFSQKGENDKVWGSIGGHVFCYQYDWD